MVGTMTKSGLCAFFQDPTRTGSGLPLLDGKVCQRCFRNVPKPLLSRLLEEGR